jgi:hypothetical protein
MLPTYRAVLTDNRLEWSGETPPGLTGRGRVHVTLLDPPTPDADRGKRAVAALERFAALGGLAEGEALATAVVTSRERGGTAEE